MVSSKGKNTHLVFSSIPTNASHDLYLLIFLISHVSACPFLICILTMSFGDWISKDSIKQSSLKHHLLPQPCKKSIYLVFSLISITFWKCIYLISWMAATFLGQTFINVSFPLIGDWRGWYGLADPLRWKAIQINCPNVHASRARTLVLDFLLQPIRELFCKNKFSGSYGLQIL